MKKKLVFLSLIVILASCYFILPKSSFQKVVIENLSKPKDSTTYYNNLEKIYSYGLLAYEETYKELRKAKIESEDYTEFAKKAWDIQGKLTKKNLIYYDVYIEQLKYAKAMTIDPSSRIINALSSNAREIEKAKEKNDWLISSKDGIGNESSFNMSEATFEFLQTSEEVNRLNKLLND